MKKLIVVASLLLASAFGAAAQNQGPMPPPVEEQLKLDTIAVYHGKQVCKWNETPGFFGPDYEWGCEFKSDFICTATVVQATGLHTYAGLTAGHCFDWDEKDNYYVADDLADQPVVHKITLTKFENDARYDFALFEFKSLTDYEPMKISLGELPGVGDEVLNVNFALGLTKQYVKGHVVSDVISHPIPGLKDCKGRYLVSIGIGPGASGSAVVDLSIGKIVGIVEAIFPGTQMPTVVMPIGKTFRNFVEDDSAGLKPEPAVGEPSIPKPKTPPTSNEMIHTLLGRLWQWVVEDINKDL